MYEYITSIMDFMFLEWFSKELYLKLSAKTFYNIEQHHSPYGAVRLRGIKKHTHFFATFGLSIELLIYLSCKNANNVFASLSSSPEAYFPRRCGAAVGFYFRISHSTSNHSCLSIPLYNSSTHISIHMSVQPTNRLFHPSTNTIDTLIHLHTNIQTYQPATHTFLSLQMVCQGALRVTGLLVVVLVQLGAGQHAFVSTACTEGGCGSGAAQSISTDEYGVTTGECAYINAQGQSVKVRRMGGESPSE